MRLRCYVFNFNFFFHHFLVHGHGYQSTPFIEPQLLVCVEFFLSFQSQLTLEHETWQVLPDSSWLTGQVELLSHSVATWMWFCWGARSPLSHSLTFFITSSSLRTESREIYEWKILFSSHLLDFDFAQLNLCLLLACRLKWGSRLDNLVHS